MLPISAYWDFGDYCRIGQIGRFHNIRNRLNRGAGWRVALSLKDQLSNLPLIMIILFRPFKVGDFNPRRRF